MKEADEKNEKNAVEFLSAIPTVETSLLNKPQNQVMEDLVTTAVTFLQNPVVAVRPRQEKIYFLAKKGLTDLEISTAFMKVGNSVAVQENGNDYQITYDGLAPPLIPQRSLTSTWSAIKSMANVFILISSAAYGCHYLYQWILRTYFKGHKTKDQQKFLADFQDNMHLIMEKLQYSLDQIRIEKSNQNILLTEVLSEGKSVNGGRNELLNELACIKSLLLNKHAFPAAPVTGISLPEWQRIKEKTDVELHITSIKNGVDNYFPSDSDVSLHESLDNTTSSGGSVICKTANSSEGKMNVDLAIKNLTDDYVP